MCDDDDDDVPLFAEARWNLKIIISEKDSMIREYKKQVALLKSQISAQKIRFKTLEKDYNHAVSLRLSRNRQLEGEIDEIQKIKLTKV